MKPCPSTTPPPLTVKLTASSKPGPPTTTGRRSPHSRKSVLLNSRDGRRTVTQALEVIQALVGIALEKDACRVVNLILPAHPIRKRLVPL